MNNTWIAFGLEAGAVAFAALAAYVLYGTEAAAAAVLLYLGVLLLANALRYGADA